MFSKRCSGVLDEGRPRPSGIDLLMSSVTAIIDAQTTLKQTEGGIPVNFSLALAETPREVSIDGESFLLIKRSALEALLPVRQAGGDHTTRSQPARVASPRTSRPAPKKLKAPSSKPATRATAAPKPDASKPVSGALRATVLAEIQASPGRTSLDLFDVIRQKIPTTTSGSVYQSAKALVRDGLVKGQQTDEGTIGWHPVRATRKAAVNNVILNGPASLPNAPGSHPTLS